MMPTERAPNYREFLTPAELAELLRVPLETVRTWRKNGKGPRAFRLTGSRRILYARDDVDAWVTAARDA